MITLLNILACIPVEWNQVPNPSEEEHPEMGYSWKVIETYQAMTSHAKILVAVEAANTYVVSVTTKLGSKWGRFRHMDEIPHGVRLAFGRIVDAALREHQPETVHLIVPAWAERSVVEYLDEETSRSLLTWRMIEDNLYGKTTQGNGSRHSFRTLVFVHKGHGSDKATLESHLVGEQWAKTERLRKELAQAEEQLAATQDRE